MPEDLPKYKTLEKIFNGAVLTSHVLMVGICTHYTIEYSSEGDNLKTLVAVACGLGNAYPAYDRIKKNKCGK